MPVFTKSCDVAALHLTFDTTTCATAWYKQCSTNWLRNALLLRSCATLFENPQTGVQPGLNICPPYQSPPIHQAESVPRGTPSDAPPTSFGIPLAAAGDVHYHVAASGPRRGLHDVLAPRPLRPVSLLVDNDRGQLHGGRSPWPQPAMSTRARACRCSRQRRAALKSPALEMAEMASSSPPRPQACAARSKSPSAARFRSTSCATNIPRSWPRRA
jgi:hypothetical protein